MDLNAEHIALFDAYIREELTAANRLNFEERLNNNTDFKAEFEAFQLFEQDLVNSEVTVFMDRLKVLDKATEANRPLKKGRIIPLKLMGLAASILIALFVTVIYIVGEPSHQELAMTYFEPYDNVITVRGAKEDLDEALIHYESANYKKAITLFSAYPNHLDAQFYKSESHLALNEYEAAITAFKMVLNSNGIFNEIAEYHLALAYIGNDDIKRARKTLTNINKTSSYYDSAQELLGDLE